MRNRNIVIEHQERKSVKMFALYFYGKGRKTKNNGIAQQRDFEVKTQFLSSFKVHTHHRLSFVPFKILFILKFSHIVS